VSERCRNNRRLHRVVKLPGLCGSLLIKKEIKGRGAVMSVLAIHATGRSIIVIIIIKIKSPLSVEIFIAPLYLVYTSIRNILYRYPPIAITENVYEREYKRGENMRLH